MQQKKRPPGGGRCDRLHEELGPSSVTPIADNPQAIFIEHSAHAAISVALSRDRGRLIITAFAKVDGAWRQVGQAASLPAILIDSAIDALQALREQMAPEASR